MPAVKLSLKGRALRYLAAREHSKAELLRKLKPHVSDDEDGASELQRMLDELSAKGFISEERVVESVIYRRAERLGSARVLQELRAKDLPELLLKDAAARLRETELTRAQHVWRKKFSQPPKDPSERARQMRFLASRGFDSAVIRQTMALALSADTDSSESGSV